MSELSHINEDGQPGMVDVSAKADSLRTATARALITLPDEVRALIDGDEIQSKKGPVFQTAIIAGTQAAKKTAELIPLCHPIGLDACDLTIKINDKHQVEIRCTTRVRHRTGVEMEALTAVSAAALTVYDMCKAASHNLVIHDIRLLEKTGGKSDYQA